MAPKDEHIRRGRLGDLFLDTPGCNAHTTGCDALWGGLPVLTLVGEKMATRVAASLLRCVRNHFDGTRVSFCFVYLIIHHTNPNNISAAGLPELVCTTPEAYENLAVALATDPPRLEALRRRLIETRETCPLFDTARWVRNYERGLQEVWAGYCQGRAPQDVVVREEGGGME